MNRSVHTFASILRASALIALGFLAIVQSGSATIGPTTTATYKFVGTCGDCSGTGTGFLTLQNYTPGTALSLSNFVSFTYSSNLLNLNLTTTVSSLTGNIPAGLPATAQVVIQVGGGDVFASLFNGIWCAGESCAADSGPSSSWTLVSTTTPSVPALNTPVLLGLAAMLALLGGFRAANWASARV